MKRKIHKVYFNRLDTGSPVLLYAGKRSRKKTQQAVRRIVPHYLFHYLTSGSGTVIGADGSANKVKAGDWFFIFPGQEIIYTQNPDDKWCYRWLAFQGDGTERILKRANIFPETTVLTSTPNPVIIKLHDKIMATFASNIKSRDLEVNALLMQIFARLIENTPKSTAPKINTQKNHLEQAVKDACVFMMTYYKDGIRVDEVIQQSGYERTYFSKVFSQYTNTTIRDYLANLRLQKAKELLNIPLHKVEDIALQTGFDSSKVFARFFKQKTGQSPAIWRTVKQSTTKTSSRNIK